jgi:hypothetical protein
MVVAVAVAAGSSDRWVGLELKLVVLHFETYLL